MFTFRIYNLRKRQLCTPILQVKLLMKDAYGNYNFHELDFENHKQVGRSRDVTWSSLYLPLPWTISHPINQLSPLYGMNKKDMIAKECEVIVIFDVIDELSSKNFQVRWSYLPREIVWDQEFAPMVSRREGELWVDCDKLSETQQKSASIQVLDETEESDSS